MNPISFPSSSDLSPSAESTPSKPVILKQAETAHELLQILSDNNIFCEKSSKTKFDKTNSNLNSRALENLKEILSRKISIQCLSGAKSESIYRLLKELLKKQGLLGCEVTVAGSYVLKILGWSFVEEIFCELGLPIDSIATPELIAELKVKFEKEPHDIDIRVDLSKSSPPQKFDWSKREELLSRLEAQLKSLLGDTPNLKKADNIAELNDQYLCLYLGMPGSLSAEICLYESLAKRNLCVSDALHIKFAPYFFLEENPNPKTIEVQSGKSSILDSLIEILLNKITLFEPEILNSLVWPRLIQQISRGKFPEKDTLDKPLYSALLACKKGSKGVFLGNLLNKRCREATCQERLTLLKLAEESCLRNTGTLGLTEQEIQKMKSTVFPNPLFLLCFEAFKDPSTRNKDALVKALLRAREAGDFTHEFLGYLHALSPELSLQAARLKPSRDYKFPLEGLCHEYLLSRNPELELTLPLAIQEFRQHQWIDQDLFDLISEIDPGLAALSRAPIKKDRYPNEVQRLCYEALHEKKPLDRNALSRHIYALLAGGKLDEETISYIDHVDPKLTQSLAKLNSGELSGSHLEISQLYALYILNPSDSLKNEFAALVQKLHSENQLTSELKVLINKVDPQLNLIVSKNPSPIQFCGALIKANYFRGAWEIYKNLESPQTTKTQFLKALMDRAIETNPEEALSLLLDPKISKVDRAPILEQFLQTPPSSPCAVPSLLIAEGCELLKKSSCKGVLGCRWLFERFILDNSSTLSSLPKQLLGEALNQFPEKCREFIHRFPPLYTNEPYPYQDALKTLVHFKGTFTFFKLAQMVEHPSRELAELVFEEYRVKRLSGLESPQDLKFMTDLVCRMAALMDPDKLIEAIKSWNSEERKRLLNQEGKHLKDCSAAKSAAALYYNTDPFPVELFRWYPTEDPTHWIKAFSTKSHKEPLSQAYVNLSKGSGMAGSLDKQKTVFNLFLDAANSDQISELPTETIQHLLPEDKASLLYKTFADKLLKTFVPLMTDKDKIEKYLALTCEWANAVEQGGLRHAPVISRMENSHLEYLLDRVEVDEYLLVDICIKLAKQKTPEARVLLFKTLKKIKNPVNVLSVLETIRQDTELFSEIIRLVKLDSLAANGRFHVLLKSVVEAHYEELKECPAVAHFLKNTPGGQEIDIRSRSISFLQRIEAYVDECVSINKEITFLFPGGDQSILMKPLFFKICKERLGEIEKNPSDPNQKQKITIFQGILQHYICVGDCSLTPKSDLQQAYQRQFSRIREMPQKIAQNDGFVELFKTMLRAVLNSSDIGEDLKYFIYTSRPKELPILFRELTPPVPKEVLEDIPFLLPVLNILPDRIKYFNHFFYLIDQLIEESKKCPPAMRFHYIELIGFQLFCHYPDIQALTEKAILPNLKEEAARSKQTLMPEQIQLRLQKIKNDLLTKFLNRVDAYMALPEQNLLEHRKKRNIVENILSDYFNLDTFDGGGERKISIRSYLGAFQLFSDGSQLARKFDLARDALLKAFRENKMDKAVALVRLCLLLRSHSTPLLLSEELFKKKEALMKTLYEEIIPQSCGALAAKGMSIQDILLAIQSYAVDNARLVKGKFVNFGEFESDLLYDFPEKFLESIQKIPAEYKQIIPPEYFDLVYLRLQVLKHRVCELNILPLSKAKEANVAGLAGISDIENETITVAKMFFTDMFDKAEEYPNQHLILLESYCHFAYKTESLRLNAHLFLINHIITPALSDKHSADKVVKIMHVMDEIRTKYEEEDVKRKTITGVK